MFNGHGCDCHCDSICIHSMQYISMNLVITCSLQKWLVHCGVSLYLYKISHTYLSINDTWELEMAYENLLRSAVGMTHVFRSAPSTFPLQQVTLCGVCFRESLVYRLYSEIDQIHLNIEAQCGRAGLPRSMGSGHLIYTSPCF